MLPMPTLLSVVDCARPLRLRFKVYSDLLKRGIGQVSCKMERLNRRLSESNERRVIFLYFLISWKMLANFTDNSGTTPS